MSKTKHISCLAANTKRSDFRKARKYAENEAQQLVNICK